MRTDDIIARLVFDNISDGVFTVDEQCVITSFNKAAERVTGFRSSEAVGKHCFEIFRTEVCHLRCALRDTLANSAPVENARVTIITHDGREVPISVSTKVLRDEQQRVLGAVEFFRDLSETEQLRSRLQERNTLEAIVSVCPAVKHLIETLPNVAASDCSVLIEGPSGSGKELFAQAIHSLSPRRYGPYIKLNCAALPHALLESELFGYTKGAFTDAKRDKPGMFSMANGGTLLLDEIGEMDASLQVKLLRVLNDGEFQPLGSTKTLRTDARIIAATNADLAKAIEEKRFREDLYFRINVVTITLPPLRERPEDVALLVDHFIAKLRAKTGSRTQRISPKALAVLHRYSFPGNIRELENAIEHAFVMCAGEEIEIEHLPHQIIESVEAGAGTALPPTSEKQLIAELLARHHGNKSRVASELGMHRTTLWRKLKQYQLVP